MIDGGPPRFDFAPFLDGGTFSINGQPVANIYWDGGVRTIVFPGPQGKLPLLALLYPDPNHIQAVGDQNSDGLVDYQFASVLNGGTLTETEQWDHNFDGVLDDVIQRTISQGDAGDFVLSVSETQLINADGGYALPDAGGSWVVTQSTQGPALDGQADGAQPEPDCSGFDGLPINLPPADIYPVPGHPQMAVAMNYAGACPAASAERLAIAMQASVDQLYDCLNAAEGTQDSFNFIAWAKLLVAEMMLSWHDTRLYVYCNDTCDGSLAVTAAYGCWSQGPIPGQSLAINLRSPAGSPASFTLSDDQLSETLTHELVHFAGYSHIPQPLGTPPAHDRAYSCGRYCNGCRSAVTVGGADTPQGFHEDCADCADDSHRFLCGFNYVTTESACPNNSSTMGCVSDPSTACTDCSYIVVNDCNGLPDPIYEPATISSGSQYCCNSGCSNDSLVSCSTATILNTKDGCNQYPAGQCPMGF